MEAQRKKMSLEQGKHHEQSKRYGFNDGRRTSRSAEVVGTTLGERKSHRDIPPTTKSDAFSIRQGPPAKGQNGLRDVSQLDMVQFTGRSKVLLQDNAHDQLERQRLQSDNHVRREISGVKKRNGLISLVKM